MEPWAAVIPACMTAESSASVSMPHLLLKGSVISAMEGDAHAAELAQSMAKSLIEIDRLLGRISGDFDDASIALFVCPVCSDLGCGALTIELRATTDTISWVRFGWQDGITDEPQPWPLPEQSLSFERVTYESELLALRDHFEHLIKPGRPSSAPDPRYSIRDRVKSLFA